MTLILVNSLKIYYLFAYYRKLATSEVSKNVILNILFLFCFFLRLIVCCFDVPFSIGQRRSYIIPCISVDDFKMALSSKDLSEHERILHQTSPILINIIGFKTFYANLDNFPSQSI